MNFEEFAAKPLLRAGGIATPEGYLAKTPEQVSAIADTLGPCVIKAQVPTGKRGKAGGIKLAQNSDEAAVLAKQILGMEIDGFAVGSVLVEQQIPIAKEYYAAVLTDAASKGPMLLFSTEGGMDIEEVAAQTPEKLLSLHIDVLKGAEIADVQTMLASAELGDMEAGIAEALCQLYEVFMSRDAELLEVNPLVVTKDNAIVALDCKFSMDDAGISRQDDIADTGTPDKLTELEMRGKEQSLKYIELDGNVGILANGAGLTMTTMDVVSHYGGKPANFLEIGGDSYTRAKPAIELVLSNPNVKSLVVNFCGAIARADVMVTGVIDAWEELKPDIPIFFSINGTGDLEGIAILKERMGMEPYADMDSASKAAVEAAAQ